MSDSPFCKTCGGRVEWHVTKAGRNMPIDPDPRPDGKFVFGAGLKLEFAPATTPMSRRRFMCHWDTSPRCKPPRAPVDRDEMTCFKCGENDHFARECPNG